MAHPQARRYQTHPSHPGHLLHGHHSCLVHGLLDSVSCIHLLNAPGHETKNIFEIGPWTMQQPVPSAPTDRHATSRQRPTSRSLSAHPRMSYLNTRDMRTLDTNIGRREAGAWPVWRNELPTLSFMTWTENRGAFVVTHEVLWRLSGSIRYSSRMMQVGCNHQTTTTEYLLLRYY